MPGQIPTNPYDPNAYNQQPSISGDQVGEAIRILQEAFGQLGQQAPVQYSGNIPPRDVTQYRQPPPAPKSDISPVPGQPQDFDAANAQVPANQVPMGEDQAAMGAPNPVAAQDTVGEQVKTQELQPGNRRSIKEYLAEINKLREQMRAQGVPEDQLPVPSFTNIQGGEMDKVQGYLGPGEGQAGPPQEVRSYMTPEWKANADPNRVPTEMGQAHPIQQVLNQVKAQSPTIQRVVASGALQNDMDPRWPMAVAFDTIDDWTMTYYDQNGKYPDAKKVSDTFHRLRSQAFKAQGENIAKYQKMFPGSDQEKLWKAFRTGNWAEVSKLAVEMKSGEKDVKIADDARKRWDKMRDEENAAPLDVDGYPFPDQQTYINYKVQQYRKWLDDMEKAAHGNQGSGPQMDQKAPQGSTGGPQRSYTPPQEGPAPTQTVSAGGPAPGATVVNEGTMPDGRRVKQYSDGSIYDEKGNRIK